MSDSNQKQPSIAATRALRKKQVDDLESFAGKRLRVIRHARGVTQKDLARHLGVTFQQIQKYEGGSRLSFGKLVAAMEYLKVGPDIFFEGCGLPQGKADIDLIIGRRMGDKITEAMGLIAQASTVLAAARLMPTL